MTEARGKPVPWRLREATVEDRDQILALRERVFATEDPEKRLPQFWDWEFRASPAGPARLFVADDGGRIVGHYAIIPQRFVLGGAPCTGSIVVDVMTDPDYRFQGMFKKLGRFALASARGEIAFATGYPIRKEVMPGHLSIGWLAHSRLPVLLRPLRPGAIASRFRVPGGRLLDALLAPAHALRRRWDARRAPRELRFVELDDTALERMAEVASAGLAEFANHQVRDAAYLRYRYLRNPSWRYRLAGAMRGDRLVAWCVLRDARLLDTPSLAVVDLCALPGEDPALVHLLRHELAAGRDRGLAIAGAMITRGHRFHAALRRAGLYPGPHQFTLIVYTVQEAPLPALADPSQSWLLTWGDTDDV